MKYSRNPVLAGVTTAVLLLGSSANAGVLFDNLSQTSNGAAHVTSSYSGPLAASFSTGSNAAELTDVKLLLQADTSITVGEFGVRLLSDNAGSPVQKPLLAFLGFVVDTSLSATPNVIDFSSFSPYLLAANTTYWVELIETGSGTQAELSYTNSTSGVGVAGESFYYGGGVHPNSEGPYQMQVNATVVPEPSTLALLGLGGLGLLGSALRRRQSDAIV